MRRIKPLHGAALGALLGLLVPVAVEAVLFFHPFTAGGWLLLIWPSSIMTMVLEFHPSRTDVLTILIESIVINVFLYAGVGWCVAFAVRRRTNAP